MAIVGEDATLNVSEGDEGLEYTQDMYVPPHGRLRLTAEEKLAREVSRRREQELERRARIFDAKRRTIGVDKEALDAQVAERKRREENERQHRFDGASEMLAIDRNLKLIEAENSRLRRQAEMETRQFSTLNLSKDRSDTYDLNDKFALRKSQPMRLGDNDPRCGPASMLKFGGEDLMKAERVRQQQLQQVMFIEQQKFEKTMLAEDGADSAMDKETAEMITLRTEMEEEEKGLRKALLKQNQVANIEHAYERAHRRSADIEEQMETDAAELYHHANDAFLNEKGTQAHNGRVRRAEYKGSTREDRFQGRLILEQQAEERVSHKLDSKVFDMQFAGHQEFTRRQMVLLERERARKKREAAMAVAQENQQLRIEHGTKTKAINELYTNKFSPEFFEQFGTGCR